MMRCMNIGKRKGNNMLTSFFFYYGAICFGWHIGSLIGKAIAWAYVKYLDKKGY